MKFLLIFKKYFIYITLLLTLLSATYFKYQDLHHDDSVNIAEVVEHRTASTNVEITQGAINRPIFAKEKTINKKIDIFDVYKKPTAVVETKKNAPHQAVVTLNPVVSIPPQEPQPPSAPKIPFKYIGKIWGDDEYQVFIGVNGKSLIIKEGDIIQQMYKVEKISPPTMTLTYLPMNILQSMQIGEPN